jgi:superfamily II DNA or RNA helicase
MTPPQERWDLGAIAANVRLAVTAEGLSIEIEPHPSADWRTSGLGVRDASSGLGAQLPTLLPQLEDLGVLNYSPRAFVISHVSFVDIETHEIDAFVGYFAWSPFSVALESTGWLASSAYRYLYDFRLGVKKVSVERLGSIIRRGADLYRLDPTTFKMLEAVDAFNAAPEARRASEQALLTFAEIKGLATELGAELDVYLRNERVLIPPTVGLDLVVDSDDRISFAPKIDGVDQDSLRTAFFGSDDIEPVYTVIEEGGQRLRVVLQERHKEILRRMQRVRHLGGVSKAEVLRDPTAVFDGVADDVEIDLRLFGNRVYGIGSFPFVAQPYLDARTGTLELPEDAKLHAGIRCRYFDGRVEDLTIPSVAAARMVQDQARTALASGKDVIDVDGRSIVVDTNFVTALEELVVRLSPIGRARIAGQSTPKKPARYLLVYTNDSELNYSEPLEEQGDAVEFTLPAALRPGARLEPYQVLGTRWLFESFARGRRGSLLADDMGLGKTLQVLTFLAALLEQPLPDHVGPIVIVCPTMLLELQTWERDAKKFFRDDGSVFQPWITLRGAELRGHRLTDGTEASLGQPVLDLDRLRESRVVVTNYETVTNYQYSFSRLKDSVRVLVLDEAHEAKTPNTKISHALKSMSPRFRIASTGTPVETRLLDAWNIIDILQPGLLGAATDFSAKFEESSGAPGEAVRELRQRLKFGERDAFVLRRSKEESLTGFPKKHEHILKCDLTNEQRLWHVKLIDQLKSGSHALSVLKDLIRLYQHPRLLPHFEPLAPAAALAASTKLAATVECLQGIKLNGEKCLVFTRTLDMQQLLATVLEDAFGVHVDIVNGSTGKTGSHRKSRASVLEGFSATPGFGVLVLSPDVAGVGLTITAANHVIHYGRWWNPARESQATDRVYRLGQTRDVHVYVPITSDPTGQFETFDEKLDSLLRRRRALASEFLMPLPSEDDLGRELLNSLKAEPSQGEPKTVVMAPSEVRQLRWSEFEALVAALETARTRRVCLTPLAGDDGVDVVAVSNTEIRLVQCKHTSWGATVQPEVVDEVMSGFEAYRAKHIPNSLRRLRLVPVLVTNGEFARSTRTAAERVGVQLVSGTDLQLSIMELKIATHDLDRCARRRLESLGAVRAWLSAEGAAH